MYTEENEFDYNEYLEESENQSSGKGKGLFWLIFKILIIVLCIGIIIFLVFKIKNRSVGNDVDNSLLVFNNNVAILRSASETYYFDNGNYPKNVSESVSVNIQELIDEGLVTDIKDYDGNTCGYTTSYMNMTRNSNDYMLKIYLSCPSIENSVVYYYDLEGNCLTCNGEEYTPSTNEVEDNQGNNNSSNNNNNSDNNNNSNNNSNNNNEEKPSAVCGNFSDWTTEYKTDSNLEKETRIVVKGYKDNIRYGEWSTPTTLEIKGNSNLEVKTEVREETVTSKTNWSSESTTKPQSKSGREISSRSVKKAYTTEECTKTTYTKKNLTLWDNKADKCVVNGIGDFTCTYSLNVCDDVTKYKTVTYYKYRDTKTSVVKTTYYSSREIFRDEPSYTGYILESEMPDGYQKLNGSEVTQYRYREKCSK